MSLTPQKLTFMTLGGQKPLKTLKSMSGDVRRPMMSIPKMKRILPAFLQAHDRGSGLSH